MSIQLSKEGKLDSYKDGLLQAKSHKILREEVNDVLKNFDLSMTEWVILCLLHETNNLRLAEIGAVLEVESPYVTNIVELLVKKNLVVRVGHTVDKRAKVVTLTESGEKILPGIEYAVVEQMKKVLKGISEKELNAYVNVQQAIINNSSK